MLDCREVAGCPLSFGTVSVSEQVTAFQRKRVSDHENLDLVALDMPEQHFSTQALWYELPDDVLERDFPLEHLLGSLHAAEHTQIAVLPLIAMCDRWDIGGLSTNYHSQTGRPTVFIYDGHPGGIGITRLGFHRFETLVRDAMRLISECPCRSGCPSCVQSPKCGNLNEPLNKNGALELLSRLAGLSLQGALQATFTHRRRRADSSSRCVARSRYSSWLLMLLCLPGHAQAGDSGGAIGAAGSPSPSRPRWAARRRPILEGARRAAQDQAPGGSQARRGAARLPAGEPSRQQTRPAPAPRRRETGHRFPLVGTYSYGGSGSRFGAARKGHTHQGQDLAAAEGTPIVAPRGGIVEAVAYQAGGAGHYAVIDGQRRGPRLRVHAHAHRVGGRDQGPDRGHRPDDRRGGQHRPLVRSPTCTSRSGSAAVVHRRLPGGSAALPARLGRLRLTVDSGHARGSRAERRRVAPRRGCAARAAAPCRHARPSSPSG